MRVLDIDLDFFLNAVAYHQSEGRLDASDYKPWKEPDVRSFLEQQCGLSKSRLLPCRFVERHHEAFFFWRELIQQQKLRVPFEVIHVDAHSDLGCGDAGYVYLITDVLHRPIGDRADLEHGGRRNLNEGNYLSFALGCEWLSSLVFVKNPKARDDLMYFHFKDFSSATGRLQLKRCTKELLDKIRFQERPQLPASCLMSEVPFQQILGPAFSDHGPYDFGVLCHSAAFTPASADSLIPVIQEYMTSV